MKSEICGKNHQVIIKRNITIDGKKVELEQMDSPMKSFNEHVEIMLKGYGSQKLGKEVMLERKLVTFWAPNSWAQKKLYTISYAYYKDGKWTGESEEAQITEAQLYELIKPVLIFQKEKL